MLSRAPNRWMNGPKMALCVGVVVLAACLCGIFTRPLGHLSAFWPANAILVGLLVRRPRWATAFGWLGATIGYLAADLSTGESWQETLLLTTGNLAGVVTGYLLLSRLPEEDQRLRRPFSVAKLLLIVCAMSAASGLVGAVADPVLFGGTPLGGWVFWFISEMVNYMAVLPVMLTLPAPPWARLERRRAAPPWRARLLQALPAIALVLSGAMSVILGGPGAVAFPVPALLWCALTYSVFSTAVLTVLFSAWALISISLGLIPVAGGDVNSRPMLLSIRTAVMLISLAPLTVACVMAARNELLARIQHIASHDQLSGLLNRHAFHDLCAAAAADPAVQRRPLAVLMLDIDHFKNINDAHGHAAGDQVLAAFAKLASACLRDGDLFGRLGGEEFTIFLPGCGGDEARAIAERVRATFATATTAAGTDLQIAATVSIGAAISLLGPRDVDAMLLTADKALYRAKSAGRNRVEWEEVGA